MAGQTEAKKKSLQPQPTRKPAQIPNATSLSRELDELHLPREASEQASYSRSNAVAQPSPGEPFTGSTLTKAAPRIDLPAEYKAREQGKDTINLVIVGHVDAGKSTLMGHLLYLLGQVPARVLRKYEQESTEMGKASFHFAWVMDATEEERSRGVTIDIATSTFQTANKHFTILDAPGHRDFIPNMISGTVQADAAILVIDSTTGGFEAGFQDNGQTKEHAILVRSLGVQQLVVAVNKLDGVGWSEARYQEIRDQLDPFLTQIGFKSENLVYVPCSGLQGTNLIQRPTPQTAASLAAWYPSDGPCLIDAIDQFKAPPRALKDAFRLAVADFFKGSLIGGGPAGSGNGETIGTSGATTVTLNGRIESGTIQVGERVMLVPSSELGVVKAIDYRDEICQWAVAGDNVLITVQGIDMLQYSVGSVLCTPKDPIPTTSRFVAQIVLFDVKVPVTQGFPVLVHYQSRSEPAFVSKLLAQLDKSTGEVIKKKPRCLSKSTTAKVEITLQTPICLDSFKRSKSFGRITLRKGVETIGAGIVLKYCGTLPSIPRSWT